jgi:hypothetical protein
MLEGGNVEMRRGDKEANALAAELPSQSQDLGIRRALRGRECFPRRLFVLLLCSEAGTVLVTRRKAGAQHHQQTAGATF